MYLSLYGKITCFRALPMFGSAFVPPVHRHLESAPVGYPNIFVILPTQLVYVSPRSKPFFTM